jgi:hypothetical protein
MSFAIFFLAVRVDPFFLLGAMKDFSFGAAGPAELRLQR